VAATKDVILSVSKRDIAAISLARCSVDNIPSTFRLCGRTSILFSQSADSCDYGSISDMLLWNSRVSGDDRSFNATVRGPSR
jgi:hypothetical protein